MSKSASLAIARVMAHCGGSPAAAVAQVAGAIANDPADPEPYEVIAELRGQSPADVAAAVAAPSRLWQFVAGSYLSFLDGDMDQAARRLGSVVGYRPQVALGVCALVPRRTVPRGGHRLPSRWPAWRSCCGSAGVRMSRWPCVTGRTRCSG